MFSSVKCPALSVKAKYSHNGQRHDDERHHPYQIGRSGPLCLFHRPSPLRAVHDVDLVRPDVHADELAHLRRLGGVDHPLVARLPHVHLVMHALEDDVFHHGPSAGPEWRAPPGCPPGAPPPARSPRLRKARVHAGEFLPGEFHAEVPQHHAVQDVAIRR